MRAFWRWKKGRHALGGPVRQPAAYGGVRVELTFRDGTSTALDPAQAGALEELARVLTSRDEVKG